MSLKPHKLKILFACLLVAMLPVMVNVLVQEWPLPEPQAPDENRFDYHHDRLGTVVEDMIEAGRQEITRIDPTFWARGATQWYASASGSGTACSIGSPCTLYTAMCGTQCSAFNPQPGDTINVRGGNYAIDSFPAALSLRQNGSLGNQITYRRYGQEHAKIDCKGDVTPTSQCLGQPYWNGTAVGSGNYTTVWGLDFVNSSTQARITNDAVGQGCAASDTCQPTEQTQIFVKALGFQLIDNFMSDMIDGVQWASGAPPSPNFTPPGQTAKLARGNVVIYSGYVGSSQRAHGHSFYVQNWPFDGESGRSYHTGNIGIRSFADGTQIYAHGAGLGYITFNFNSIIGAGIPVNSSTWPSVGCCEYSLYMGGGGSAAASCTIGAPPNGTGGYEDLFYNDIVDSNVVYGNGGLQLGGSKGACQSTITNNFFADLQSFTWLTGAVFNTITMTGNTFFATPTGTGGPAPVYNATNYPTNTYNTAFPISGTSGPFYWASPDEIGYGKVDTFNWAGQSTVSINLDSMGCFAGEQYQIMNYQDPNPWTGHVITTGTCTGSGDVISVSTTTANIQQPGFTTDGSTPWPKPPDLGPTFAGFILFPNVSAGAGTPTPTNTNTNTPTNTATSTNTPTNTSTPVPTNTVTPTPSFTPAFTSTPTLTPSSTPTASPTAQPLNSLQFGVDKCTAMAPMTLTTDSGAISGHHASSTVINQGDLVCKFYVPVDGTYRVWVHVIGQDAQDDSFFIDVDGDRGFNSLTPTPTPAGNTPTPTVTPNSASGHVFDSIEQSQPCTGLVNTCQYQLLGYQTYVWNPLNDRVGAVCGLCGPGTYTERQLPLTVAGNPHYLTFRAREATNGETARLDYFVLTTDLNGGAPSIQPTPTPNPNAICRQYFRCNQKAGYRNVPCSMLNDGAIPKPGVPCPFQR